MDTNRMSLSKKLAYFYELSQLESRYDLVRALGDLQLYHHPQLSDKDLKDMLLWEICRRIMTEHILVVTAGQTFNLIHRQVTCFSVWDTKHKSLWWQVEVTKSKQRLGRFSDGKFVPDKAAFGGTLGEFLAKWMSRYAQLPAGRYDEND